MGFGTDWIRNGEEITVKIGKTNGRPTIGCQSLVYCNTRYHRPYLAIVRGKEMDWQPIEYVGYGKKADPHYVVENIQPGDLIQVAGGSGGNKYPFKGRVVSITENELMVKKLSDAEFGNARANYTAAELNEDELRLVKELKELKPERLSLILAMARKEGTK
ncbi:MAG: hypothetical protein JRI33_06455 [Deltaproteobacteria bacterium]|nr:hypothetical protein [Deltaproteobacteria bacterium]